MLPAKNLLIDLNSIACYFGVPINKGASNEHGQNDFFSSHGIPAYLRIPQMRPALSGRLQGAKFFVHGSIFMHGLCAINLPRKFARYRILSAVHAAETLPHGHPWPGLPQHVSQRQQSARLAYLCRLRAGSDSSSPWTLSRRSIRNRAREYGLRAGLNNHRFVLIAFPMGAFSKKQGCGQTPHAFGFARTDPVIYRYHRREIRRCQYSGHLNPRGRIILHHGSRLSRLRASICHASGACHVHHPGQIQHAMPTPLFAPSRQNNGTALRSNNSFNRRTISPKLSTTTSSDQIFRFRNQQTLHLFDKQLRGQRTYCRAALQMPLESRTIFSLDQTAPAHQGFLGNITKRRQVPSLDCHLNLRAGRHYQKTSRLKAKPLHNFTDFERDHFRENAYIASTYGN